MLTNPIRSCQHLYKVEGTCIEQACISLKPFLRYPNFLLVLQLDYRSALMGHARRVLSIQSHVVFGYVGGKAAVFPLQCLGYDVDVINTVNFSNHAGYGNFGGTETSASELTAMFTSMKQNEMMVAGRLLTGYTPGPELLTAVAHIARKLKEEQPDLIYLLDPVMGDNNRPYVNLDVIPIYKSILSLANIITPNWFEVELLTDIKLHNLESLRRTLTILHETYFVPNVVISSIPITKWLLQVLPPHIRPSNDDDDDGFLLCLCSSRSSKPPPNGTSIVHARCVEKLPGYFSGVGDLFSALLIGHFNPTDTDTDTDTPLSIATAFALTKTHTILRRTCEHSASLPEDEREPTDDEQDAVQPLRRTRRMRGRELRLVQNQDVLRDTGISHCKRLQTWNSFWTS